MTAFLIFKCIEGADVGDYTFLPSSQIDRNHSIYSVYWLINKSVRIYYILCSMPSAK